MFNKNPLKKGKKDSKGFGFSRDYQKKILFAVSPCFFNEA